jgi:hypothetical protein
MLTTRNRVVAHFNDGRLLKGYTHDFIPEKESFHINEGLEPGSGTIREVKVSDLKALFFVKSFEGNPEYRDKNTYEGAEAAILHGIKIKVEFKDGEVVRGLSLGYSKAKRGFFIVPVDSRSNNERVFVVAQSTAKVIVGPEAEK